MSLSLKTQLEEFMKVYNKEVWKQLKKENRSIKYLEETSQKMEEMKQNLMEQGFREDEAMEFIIRDYLTPISKG